jgi:conjugative relaxase-like TrwC/TraI family protein
MLSIKLIKIGDEDYYLDLAAEDYYTNGGEPPGKWVGGAAPLFGLIGKVENDAFRRLLRGYLPSPHVGPDEDPPLIPLVQNAGNRDRRAAWDCTFSAPKSLSVIWSQADPEMRHEIQDSWQESVEEALAYAEEHLVVSRMGKGGINEVPVKVVAATYEHGSSRELEPQLHTHALLFNVGVAERAPEIAADPAATSSRAAQPGPLGPNRKTLSIDSRPLYRNKMFLGAYIRAAHAHKLEQKRGWRCERRGNVFEIKGVPRDICDAYSTRRKQVLAWQEKMGRFGAKAAAEAARRTRRTKKDVPPREELFKQWQAINEEMGFTTASIRALSHAGKRDWKASIPIVIDTAIKNLALAKHHFSGSELLLEALYEAVNYGVPPKPLIEALPAHLEKSSEVVRIPTRFGEPRYTTPAVLEEELAMLEAAVRAHEFSGAVVSEDIVERVIDDTQRRMAADGNELSEEQIAAIRHLTTSPHSIRILQGLAGTGKTSATLRPTIEALQLAGYTVLGAAYTGTAAQKLQAETGIPCDTIHMSLVDFELDWIRPVKHHLRQLVRAAQKKRTYYHEKPQPIHLDSKTVLIVDEAAMVNCRHYRMLLERAEKAGATLLFVGDYKQLGAIEGTSPFRSLMQRFGHASITEIKRQVDDWAKKAAKLFSQGNVAAALDMYANRRLLRMGETIDDTIEELVAEWALHCIETPEDARILTCTNDQAQELNILCQQTRLDAGPASGIVYPNRSVEITDRDEETLRTYKSKAYVGDRLMFTNNERKHGVWNGNTGTVVALDGTGGVVVRLDDGQQVTVPVSFEHIRLAYASTTHKAQGATFPLVFVLLAGSALDLPTSYVQGTRSKAATHFFTTKELWDETHELAESPLVAMMKREVDLSLAADLFVAPTAASNEREELIKCLLNDWLQQPAGGSIIVTPTQDDADRLNKLCHERRYAQAQVDWEEKLKRGEKIALTVDGKTLVGGERIRFLHGSHGHGINVNDTATVLAPDPERGTFEAFLHRSKRRVAIAEAQKVAFELEYAMPMVNTITQKNEAERVYFLEPEQLQCEAQTHSAHSTFHWQPTLQPTPTIFDNNLSCFSSTTSLSNPDLHYAQRQPAQVQTYMMNPTHAAVDWQQKMQQVNTTTYSHHAQWTHSTTQAYKI